jgi:hypothetical protein
MVNPPSLLPVRVVRDRVEQRDKPFHNVEGEVLEAGSRGSQVGVLVRVVDRRTRRNCHSAMELEHPFKRTLLTLISGCRFESFVLYTCTLLPVGSETVTKVNWSEAADFGQGKRWPHVSRDWIVGSVSVLVVPAAVVKIGTRAHRIEACDNTGLVARGKYEAWLRCGNDVPCGSGRTARLVVPSENIIRPFGGVPRRGGTAPPGGFTVVLAVGRCRVNFWTGTGSCLSANWSQGRTSPPSPHARKLVRKRGAFNSPRICS